MEMTAVPLDVFCFDDFKDILLSVFDSRREKDAKYSLRAFARDLEIRSPRLSEILSSKYGLSSHEARRIGEKLDLTPEQIDYFTDLVTAKHGRSRAERALAESRLEVLRQRPGFAKVTTGAFDIVGRWYNVPLIEMLQMTGGVIQLERFADLLGITPREVKAALDDLTRAEILIEEEGLLKKNSRYIDVRSATPAEKIREFHKAVLRQAIEAIDSQGMDQRKSTTTFMTMNSRKLPAARKAIELFEQRFIEEFEVEDKSDSVVCISMQLFTVAKDAK